jgi:hypothetical protein
VPGKLKKDEARNLGSARTVVPKEEWENFLEAFGRTHKDWPTILETSDNVTRETVKSPEMLFHAIELDLEDEKNPRINVSGRLDNKVIKYILFRPSHMVMLTSNGGCQESLEIDTVNTRTRIHLGPQTELPVI